MAGQLTRRAQHQHGLRAPAHHQMVNDLREPGGRNGSRGLRLLFGAQI